MHAGMNDASGRSAAAQDFERSMAPV
jgi:hypothetical protein